MNQGLCKWGNALNSLTTDQGEAWLLRQIEAVSLVRGTAPSESKRIGWPLHSWREELAAKIEKANDSIICTTENSRKQTRKKERVLGGRLKVSYSRPQHDWSIASRCILGDWEEVRNIWNTRQQKKEKTGRNRSLSAERQFSCFNEREALRKSDR